MDLIIQKALKDYPIGTKFFPAHINNNNLNYCIVVNSFFNYDNNGNLIAYTSFGKTCCYSSDASFSTHGNSIYERIIWYKNKNKWAEIKELPIKSKFIPGYVYKIHLNNRICLCKYEKMSDPDRMLGYILSNMDTSDFKFKYSRPFIKDRKVELASDEESNWLERCIKANKIVNRYILKDNSSNKGIILHGELAKAVQQLKDIALSSMAVKIHNHSFYGSCLDPFCNFGLKHTDIIEIYFPKVKELK